MRCARASVRVDLVRFTELEPAVVVAVAMNADEDARGTAGQPLHGLACIFQRFPGHLEQQPLLGVHASRLLWRDAKETGIEAIDMFDETTPAAIRLAWDGRVRVEEQVGIPALRRYPSNRVRAALQQLPVRLGRTRPAWKAAAKPSDCDRLHMALRILGHVAGMHPFPQSQVVKRMLRAFPCMRYMLVGLVVWAGCQVTCTAAHCPAELPVRIVG